jgi:hypothetical protein
MKQKNKKTNYEKIKKDKDKREFIKKTLLGLGTAGLTLSVLSSPLGKSLSGINTGSLTATSQNLVTNLNANKLDNYNSLDIRCSGCSWACVGCSGGCSSCTGCLGTCVNQCGLDCGIGCSGL